MQIFSAQRISWCWVGSIQLVGWMFICSSLSLKDSITMVASLGKCLNLCGEERAKRGSTDPKSPL